MLQGYKVGGSGLRSVNAPPPPSCRICVKPIEKKSDNESVTGHRQAIAEPLKSHGLTVDQIAVYLASSSTPLPLSSDCFRLAGSFLYVRGKRLFSIFRSLFESTEHGRVSARSGTCVYRMRDDRICGIANVEICRRKPQVNSIGTCGLLRAVRPKAHSTVSRSVLSKYAAVFTKLMVLAMPFEKKTL